MDEEAILAEIKSGICYRDEERGSLMVEFCEPEKSFAIFSMTAEGLMNVQAFKREMVFIRQIADIDHLGPGHTMTTYLQGDFETTTEIELTENDKNDYKTRARVKLSCSMLQMTDAQMRLCHEDVAIESTLE